MRKLFLLLLFLPLSAFATFYTGSVIMNDGTTKNGLVDIPDTSDSQTLKFKSDAKGSVEKLSINDVKSFQIINKRNQKINFESKILGGVKNSGEVKLYDKKSWVRIAKEGKITLYDWVDGGGPGFGPNPGATASVGNTMYYVQRPGEDFALILFMELESSGLSFGINNYKIIKKYAKNIFATICPTLEEKIDLDDFKKNGMGRIVELYEQNCP